MLLRAMHSHKVQVRAKYNHIGWGGWSNSVEFSTKHMPPSQPLAPLVSSITATSLRLDLQVCVAVRISLGLVLCYLAYRSHNSLLYALLSPRIAPSRFLSTSWRIMEATSLRYQEYSYALLPWCSIAVFASSTPPGSGGR